MTSYVEGLSGLFGLLVMFLSIYVVSYLMYKIWEKFFDDN